MDSYKIESIKKIGSIKISHCPTCNGPRKCEVKGCFRKTEDDEFDVTVWSNYYLLVCNGCNCVFFQTEQIDTETIDHLRSSGEYIDSQSSAIITTWPAPPKRQAPEWFKNDWICTDIFDPTNLSATLREVYLAYDKDLYTLASIGIRTCFDIVSNLLGVDSNLSFENKLTKLVAEKKILQQEKDNLEILVDAGSASAHRGWNPDPQQVSILIDVLENFIVNAIIIPTKTKKVAAIKNKIPPRPPRTR